MSSFHRTSPIAFAHRGGRAHFRENTLEAFRHAIKAGLTALETDAFVTADGHVVLHHNGYLRHLFFIRRPISTLNLDQLPKHIPTLDALCELISDNVDVSIDVKGALDNSRAIVEIWRKYRPNSMSRLWLAHDGYKSSDWKMVQQWRALDPEIHLIDSTTTKRFDLPPDEYANRAQANGLEVINLKALEWTPQLVAAVHSSGLKAFAFKAQKSSLIEHLISLGIDGIYSDHVDRLVAAVGKRT